MCDRGDDAPHGRREAPCPRLERPRQYQQRSGDDHQELVLDHVRRKRSRSECIERRQQRRDERRHAEREAQDIAAAHAATHPGLAPQASDAARIEQARDDQQRCEERIERAITGAARVQPVREGGARLRRECGGAQ